MDRAFEKIASTGLDSLTSSERFAFALYWLYLETNNGGLHQFFFNDAGKLAQDALRGLETLGASDTAGILRRAMSVFPEGNVPIDQRERREYLCEVLSPAQEKSLDDLSTEFLKSLEPVADLLAKYIERHPEEFPL
jgi:Domain of unknown function (DUF4375)